MAGDDTTSRGERATTPAPPAAPPLPPPADSTWTAKRILLVVLVAVVVVFSLFNLDDTNVSFVLFDADAPLFLVIVVMLAIGFVVGYLTRGARARRDRKSK